MLGVSETCYNASLDYIHGGFHLVRFSDPGDPLWVGDLDLVPSCIAPAKLIYNTPHYHTNVRFVHEILGEGFLHVKNKKWIIITRNQGVQTVGSTYAGILRTTAFSSGNNNF